jgi:hypothetical protein
MRFPCLSVHQAPAFIYYFLVSKGIRKRDYKGCALWLLGTSAADMRE